MNLSETAPSTTHGQSSEDTLTARNVALTLLGTILDRHTALDIALDMSDDFAALPMRERAFTRMLLTTTLRRLGQIDDLIAFAQDRPNALKMPLIRHILRLGITQLFFMDVPDHASVDTSVKLAELKGMTKQKGFVNAILRKLIREGKTRIQNQDAARLNTPEWLLKIWIDDYGLNTAAQIAEANMTEAPLDISVKEAEDRAHWADMLNAQILPTGTLRRKSGGNIRDMEGFDTGKWWVQDAAAALPATLFGDIGGHKVVDLCAAPGGKTLQLAARGAFVEAIDRSAKRMKRVEENLERMQLDERVHIEVADAAAWTPVEKPHRILLDAPCSATGTMRRHPDTGYLKTPKDISGLTAIQERLLNHAADILAEGGTLIYCTCSLQKDEGERQIERFLARRPDFARAAITPDEVGRYETLINEAGDLRILPFHLSELGGMDGFYVSRLIKRV